MVALYEAGYEVVLTQRVSADQPRFKRWTSTAFYRLLSAIADTPIPAGSADYRSWPDPSSRRCARCANTIASCAEWWPGPDTRRWCFRTPSANGSAGKRSTP